MRLQRVPGCDSRKFGCLHRRPAVPCNACGRERGPQKSATNKARRTSVHRAHETGQNFALRYFRSTEYRPGPVSASNSNPPMMLTFL